jgi:hypothetical protein
MFIHGLLFHWTSTIQMQLSLFQYKADIMCWFSTSSSPHLNIIVILTYCCWQHKQHYCYQNLHYIYNSISIKYNSIGLCRIMEANPEMPLCRLNIVHHAIAYVLVNLKIYCCYELLQNRKWLFKTGITFSRFYIKPCDNSCSPENNKWEHFVNKSPLPVSYY